MKVIVFALHSCPVSALGPYGNEWIGTPHLDALAAEGVVFDAHYANNPEPSAALRSWRSGRLLIPPLADSPIEPNAAADPAPDLLASLRKLNVRTALIRNTRAVNAGPPEFYAGWDELFDARPESQDRSPADALLRALPRILEQLEQFPSWLLWIESDRFVTPWQVPQEIFEAYLEDLIEEEEPAKREVDEDSDLEDVDDDDEDDEESENQEPVEAIPEPLTEPIRPWDDPPVGWFDRDDLASWELLHKSFAAAMTAFDADLGRLFHILDQFQLRDSCAWVFTAGMGLPLGEHGTIGLFRPWLYEELVHIPLIVRCPQAEQAGRRVSGLTQSVDLGPTLIAWFQGCSPPGLQGQSLVPLLTGERDTLHEYVCSGLKYQGISEWSIRTPKWALLVPGDQNPDDDLRASQLFVKPDDRWEVNDMRVQHLELSEQLERVLNQVVHTAQNTGPCSWPTLASKSEAESPDV